MFCLHPSSPLTKVKLINELNEREHQLGVKETVSWHSVYKDSAWIFVGGFPYELTEGDIICVFSQYGEVVNINLVRDKKTGKSKGFCFICYEDQRSTILAIKGRTIRVDHVSNYRPPKDTDDMDDITRSLREEGCAPKPPDQSLSDDEEEEEEEEVEEQYVVPVKKSKKGTAAGRQPPSNGIPVAVTKGSTVAMETTTTTRRRRRGGGEERVTG
ncbi:hypothetical protein CRUP_020022 [Coryphaenoides rupestris]|nr:hypothetical protein CRUP_020022 [Coryphaenoides rupestris]